MKIPFKEFLERAFARREAEEVELPDTVQFTYPTGVITGSRRDRRAAGLRPVHVTETVSTAEVLAGARQRRRFEQRIRARRVRKGTHRFNEQQRQQRFSQDTVRAQLAVLEAGREANPAMYDNVTRALVAKYGDQLEQLA